MRKQTKRALIWGLPLIAFLGAINTALWLWPWPYNALVLASEDRSFAISEIPLLIPLDRVVGAYRPLPRNLSVLEMAKIHRIADELESCALLIWHRDRIVFEHYGQGCTSETRLNSASMHKGLLAIAYGVAIDQGHLPGIDRPVGDYVAELHDDQRGRISLRNLLEMNSGLAPIAPNLSTFSENMRFITGFGGSHFVFERPIQLAPGGAFEYQNINSQIAGIALQNAVGQPYAEFVGEALWSKLGAKDAYVWLYEKDKMARTYSSFYARAEDWLRVGVMLKDKGMFEDRQLLNPDWIDMMTAASPTNANYGLGVWRASPYSRERYFAQSKFGNKTPTGEPWLDPEIFFLDGANGQRVYVSRNADVVIVRTGFSSSKWTDSLLPNLVIAALRQQGNFVESSELSTNDSAVKAHATSNPARGGCPHAPC